MDSEHCSEMKSHRHTSALRNVTLATTRVCESFAAHVRFIASLIVPGAQEPVVEPRRLLQETTVSPEINMHSSVPSSIVNNALVHKECNALVCKETYQSAVRP